VVPQVENLRPLSAAATLEAATFSATVCSAAAFAVAALVAGVEVAGDHDADRLHPTRHVEDRVQAALDEDVFVLRSPRPPLRLLACLFDAEELETLIVILVTAGDGREVVAPAPGEGRRSRLAARPAAPTGPRARLAGVAARCRFAVATRPALATASAPASAAAALAAGTLLAFLGLRGAVGAGSVARRGGTGPHAVRRGERLVVAIRGGSRPAGRTLRRGLSALGAFARAPAAATTAAAAAPAARTIVVFTGFARPVTAAIGVSAALGRLVTRTRFGRLVTRAVVVGSYGARPRLPALPGVNAAVRLAAAFVVATRHVRRPGVAGVGRIRGGPIGTVVLAAAPTASTAAAAPPSPTPEIVLAVTLAWRIVSATPLARRLADGCGQLVVAPWRSLGPHTCIVVAPWRSLGPPTCIVVAPWRSLGPPTCIVVAPRRPLRPHARIVVGSPAALIAALARRPLERRLHVSGRISGSRLGCRTRRRPLDGSWLGMSAHAQFGRDVVPTARLRRRWRLRLLRRLRPLGRRLLRTGRGGPRRIVGGRGAERFGERGPGIVGVVVRHDAGFPAWGWQGGDGRQPSGVAL